MDDNECNNVDLMNQLLEQRIASEKIKNHKDHLKNAENIFKLHARFPLSIILVVVTVCSIVFLFVVIFFQATHHNHFNLSTPEFIVSVTALAADIPGLLAISLIYYF